MEIAVILGAAFVVANPIISLLLVLIVAGYLIAAVCALPHGLVEAARWVGTLRPRDFVPLALFCLWVALMVGVTLIV